MAATKGVLGRKNSREKTSNIMKFVSRENGHYLINWFVAQNHLLNTFQTKKLVAFFRIVKHIIHFKVMLSYVYIMYQKDSTYSILSPFRYSGPGSYLCLLVNIVALVLLTLNCSEFSSSKSQAVNFFFFWKFIYSF